MEEIWKPIPGYEHYEVSNLGNVRGIYYKYTKIKNGQTQYCTHKLKVLKQLIDKKGYHQVGLRKLVGDKCQAKKTHRLVAFAFIPEEEGREHINHKNGVRNDNRVENLEWCTPSENQIHSRDVLKRRYHYREVGPYGTGMKGFDHFNSKPLEMCDLNWNVIKIHGCTREAAEFVGGCASGVSQVCLGKRKTYLGYKWRYIGK